MFDVFPQDLFQEMLDRRYIQQSRHPVYDLRILNYTSKAQFDSVWNPVTEVCRGLVVSDDGLIVARPFRKFFNLDGPLSVDLQSQSFTATEKLDGSLGVLYKTPEGYKVATRGSFISDQARFASELWSERYSTVAVPPDVTLLFEIIYPSNRIVVNYGDMSDLVLIGAVEISSGKTLSLDSLSGLYPGPVVSQVKFESLTDVLNAPSVFNKEGFVLHFTQRDIRFKVKHEEYVRLHRLVTDVSARRIWEVLSSGSSLEPWLDAVPDEFHSFVAETRDSLLSGFSRLNSDLDALYDEVLGSLSPGFSRADFAARVKQLSQEPLARCLFGRLDGKDCSGFIWDLLRPETHEPFFQDRKEG